MAIKIPKSNNFIIDDVFNIVLKHQKKKEAKKAKKEESQKPKVEESKEDKAEKPKVENNKILAEQQVIEENKAKLKAMFKDVDKIEVKVVE